MIRRFLLWLTASRPVELIEDKGVVFLERYYVCRLPLLGEIFIHRFIASDPDRGLHDHPYAWSLSLVLAGWYIQEKRGRNGVRWNVVSLFNFIGADTFHRVLLPAGARDVWTVFAHGPRVKAWGFLRPVEGVQGLDLPREYVYTEVSSGDESPFSDWALTAPKGREIREAA